MIFINPLKTNWWKTVVDKWSRENRPLMVAPIKAYINRPASAGFDLFGKVVGQTINNANTAYQEFYSWIQWVGVEYLGEYYDRWTSMSDCIAEYDGQETSNELTQQQYAMVGFKDNEYDTVTLVSDDTDETGSSIVHRHGFGMAMPLMSVHTSNSYGVQTSKVYGVAASPGLISWDGSSGNRRLMALFTDRQTFTIDSQRAFVGTIDLVDPTLHGVLGMYVLTDLLTGLTKNIVWNLGGTLVFNQNIITNGKRTPANVEYARPLNYTSAESLSLVPVRFDKKNQNVIMHDIPLVPNTLVTTYNASFVTAYGLNLAHPAVRSIDTEIERGRRYSLSVTTEPYQTWAPLDGGTVCKYQPCDINGESIVNDDSIQYLCVRGPASLVKSINMSLAESNYNNDIIDTVILSDPSYIDDMGTLAYDTIDQDVLRADAGIADVTTLGGSIPVFRLDEDFLGTATWEAMRYRYPGQNICVVGAGVVHTYSSTAPKTLIRLYCAGLDPTRTDIDFTDLPKRSGTTASIQVDSSGEKLGPCVRIPGMPGYVRIIKQTPIRPSRNSEATSAMYEVEVPFGMLSLSSFRYNARLETTGSVVTQYGYIKAGSFRRAELVDETGDKIVPATSAPFDNNWLGVNNRVPLNDPASDVSLVGPTEYFVMLDSDRTADTTSYRMCTHSLDHHAGINGNIVTVDCGPATISTSFGVIKRLAVVSNQYWDTLQGHIGYHGHEYPAYRMKMDVSDIDSMYRGVRGIDMSARWFLSHVVGGGNADIVKNPYLNALPYLKNDLGLWMKKSDGHWQRVVVNSRETSINSIVTTNLLIDGTVDVNYDPNSPSTPNADSKLIRFTLKNSVGVSRGLDVMYALSTLHGALYNSNIQCLYQTKSSDGTSVYCSTRSYKVIQGIFIPGADLDPSDDRLDIVAIVGPDSSMEDAKLSIESSFTTEVSGSVIGLINILEPQSNASLAASSIVQSSRIFHVFSKVPNSYKGGTVKYIGVFKSNGDASAAIASASENYWMYYNAFENVFYVWTGLEWTLFYKISDWVGIKPMFIDAQSGEFQGTGDTASPWFGLGVDGQIEILFGHQPKRYPLPEHIEQFIDMPPPYTFLFDEDPMVAMVDITQPSDLSMRYVGFLTNP